MIGIWGSAYIFVLSLQLLKGEEKPEWLYIFIKDNIENPLIKFGENVNIDLTIPMLMTIMVIVFSFLIMAFYHNFLNAYSRYEFYQTQRQLVEVFKQADKKIDPDILDKMLLVLKETAVVSKDLSDSTEVLNKSMIYERNTLGSFSLRINNRTKTLNDAIQSFKNLSDEFENKLTVGVIKAIEEERETIDVALKKRYDELAVDMKKYSVELLHEGLAESFEKVSESYIKISDEIQNMSKTMEQTGNRICYIANEFNQTVQTFEGFKGEAVKASDQMREASNYLRVAAKPFNEIISKSNELMTKTSEYMMSLYMKLTDKGESSLNENAKKSFEQTEQIIKTLVENFLEELDKTLKTKFSHIPELYQNQTITEKADPDEKPKNKPIK